MKKQQILTGNGGNSLNEKEMAKAVFLDLYKKLPKWNKQSLFVEVKIGNCSVYTICDHIKPEYRKRYGEQLSKLASIALKK